MMLFAIYLVVALLLWVPFIVAYIFHEKKEFPSLSIEFTDYLFGAFFGGFAALLWPFVIPVLGVIEVARRCVERIEAHNV